MNSILAHASCYRQTKRSSSNFYTYRKVRSTTLSCLEAHFGFFRLSLKGIFFLIAVSFWEKKIFSYYSPFSAGSSKCTGAYTTSDLLQIPLIG